jgi:hypothetical protein
VGLVVDEPLDGFAFGEVHGLSEGGGEVDVELLAGFAVDELNFGRERHGRLLGLVIQLDHNSKKIHIQEKMFEETTSQRPNASDRPGGLSYWAGSGTSAGAANAIKSGVSA